MNDIDVVLTQEEYTRKPHKLTIFYKIEFPNEIKFLVTPEPNYSNHEKIIFELDSNQNIKINFNVTERIGYQSNIQITKIMYNNYEMKNINDFCVLFKDGKAFRTHGYIDGGNYEIRIRGNPISQHFLEYLSSMI